MIQKEWDESKIADQIQIRAIRQRRPLSCMLELTYCCNFRCKMCYIRMSDAQASHFGRMRTLEEWLDMARQLRDAGVLYLTLTGGECTQYPGFVKLYERLARMGFRISILSNAGAYNDSIRDVFRCYPPYSASITLYGGSNETYAAVTGDPRGLDKVLENIRYLKSVGIPVALNFTMIRQNALDYPKVGELCRELGLSYTMITDITRHRYDPSFSDAFACRLAPAERACVACHPPGEVAEALKNAMELGKDLETFQLPAAPTEPIRMIQDACVGASTGCAISWNGDMQTCISMLGYHDVKPFEIGFEAAWLKLKAEQDETFRRPDACQICSMEKDCLHNCAGRRAEGVGSPHKPDPYVCQYVYLLELYKVRQNRVDISRPPECV